MSWLAVWTRAVVAPAWRKALGVWLGASFIAIVVFGPTGMQPGDLTRLALGDRAVGGVLATIWLLVFLPVARGLVRGDGGRFLWSLPSPRGWPTALTVGALVGFQLPWLALWVAGAGARGLAVVVVESAVIAGIAAWRPRPGRRIGARWSSGAAALRGVLVRALRRRAADALVRGAGLAILAGAVAGLLVRNNELEGTAAATLGAAAIAVVLVAAQVGVRLVLLDAHRQSAWLAQATGITPVERVVALGLAMAGVDAAAGVIAIVAAAAVGALDAPTTAWLALAVIAVALAGAAAAARTLVRGEDSPNIATRVVVDATVIAAIVGLWLGVVGYAGLAGAVATIAALAVRR